MNAVATDATHLHAAFLSGINLGKRRLTMDQLRSHFRAFGLPDAATFIASGNVVFRYSESDASELESRLEAHLAEALGFETDVLIRSFAELDRLEGHAEVGAALEDGFNAHAILVRQPPAEDAWRALRELEGPDDRFLSVGMDVVWCRRGGLLDAPFPTRALDAAFSGVPRTMRNLNTIRRMLGKFGRA